MLVVRYPILSKKIINTPANTAAASLPKLAEQVLFTPSLRQKTVKARFWVRYVPSPFSPSLGELTISEVMQITKTASIKEWWSEPGFKEWFLNKDEGRERLEYLFMLALDTAEEILLSPETQASARVNMIKIIGELASKFPSRTTEKFSDEDINKMDEKQLRNYLEKRGVVIKQENVIDVTQAEDASKES